MNLLITGALKLDDERRLEIEQMGHRVFYMPDERGELPCDYSMIEGVVCNGLFLYHQINRFTNLRYIQLTSAGLDRVPLEYIRKNGITLHNARGVYSIPIAEYVLSSVLAVYKHVVDFSNRQRNHEWNKIRNIREIYGKTVGIIGCGSVGTECAKRFAAMGCQVIGVDLSPHKDVSFSRIYPLNAIDDVLKISDVLVLTLPLSDQSWHMIGERELNLLPNGSVVINVARGAIIDTNALVNVLCFREDITAILDVFEDEPLQIADPLWNMPNLVITPHNSFISSNNCVRLWICIKENLIRESKRNKDNS